MVWVEVRRFFGTKNTESMPSSSRYDSDRYGAQRRGYAARAYEGYLVGRGASALVVASTGRRIGESLKSYRYFTSHVNRSAILKRKFRRAASDYSARQKKARKHNSYKNSFSTPARGYMTDASSVNSLYDPAVTLPHATLLHEGLGGQCTHFYGGSRSKVSRPKVFGSVAPTIFIRNSAAQITAGIGLQTSVGAMSCWTPLDLHLGDTTDVGNLMLKRGELSIRMSNAQLANCTVDIYDIFARRDIGLAAYSDPNAAWVNGDALCAGGATSNPTIVGSLPMQSPGFNYLYRVAAKTTIVLGAGQCHAHFVHLNTNKLSSSITHAVNPYGIKDITYHCMLVLSGAPANDVTTQAAVSIGKSTLNYVVSRQFEFKGIINNEPSINLSNSLSATLAGGEQAIAVGGAGVTTNLEG